MAPYHKDKWVKYLFGLVTQTLEESVNNEMIIEQLKTMLKPTQINTNSEDLYDASADRYKKYAKARKVLDVPSPLAIVYPDSPEQVRDLLVFCNTNQVNVIPRAGKTATEGGLENWKEQTLVIDALHLDRIINIDTYNMQATVQAGVPLQELEDALRKDGFTTGHSPQSKPVAKLGGLVATRIGKFTGAAPSKTQYSRKLHGPGGCFLLTLNGEHCICARSPPNINIGDIQHVIKTEHLGNLPGDLGCCSIKRSASTENYIKLLALEIGAQHLTGCIGVAPCKKRVRDERSPVHRKPEKVMHVWYYRGWSHGDYMDQGLRMLLLQLESEGECTLIIWIQHHPGVFSYHGTCMIIIGEPSYIWNEFY